MDGRELLRGDESAGAGRWVCVGQVGSEVVGQVDSTRMTSKDLGTRAARERALCREFWCFCGVASRGDGGARA